MPLWVTIVLWFLEAKWGVTLRETRLLTGKEPECCQAGLKPQCFILVCGSLACVTAFMCSSDISVIWQEIMKCSSGAGQAGAGRWGGGTPLWRLNGLLAGTGSFWIYLATKSILPFTCTTAASFQCWPGTVQANTGNCAKTPF